MDIEKFRIPGTTGLPQHVPSVDKRPREGWFLRGPVDMAWLNRAKALPKSALATGLALWFQRGVLKSDCPIKVTSAVRRKMSLTPDDARRGIRALADSGLIKVVKGGRGRHPVVQIIEHPDDHSVPSLTASKPHRQPSNQTID